MTAPESRRLLTAAELDLMSPDERAQALRDRIINDGMPGAPGARLGDGGRRLSV